MGASRRGRTLPAVIAAAAALTLAGNVTVLASGHLDGDPARSDDLVSVEAGAAPQAPAVAPLTRRHQPHLLVAGTSSLPPRAVERTRNMAGVAGVAVVDAAHARVGERRMGLLGVDPSGFRAFAPEATAKSDQLWRTIAAGGLALSFERSRDGGLPLGAVVPAGSSERSGRVRVGAYASMGIGDVDAVVSREQARRLGLPEGNALVISAPDADTRKLAARLKRVLPRGVKVAELAPAQRADRPAGRERRVRLTGRPDGVTGDSTPITGNRMTPAMRAVVLEIARLFGPFPVIGCFRSNADAQDHGHGRACDFMQSTGGRMPSAGAMRHGDQVARYAVQNAERLRISYVIWRQHIWNSRGGGWRPMPDRGSLTQNHFDHVHISVLR